MCSHMQAVQNANIIEDWGSILRDSMFPHSTALKAVADGCLSLCVVLPGPLVKGETPACTPETAGTGYRTNATFSAE